MTKEVKVFGLTAEKGRWFFVIIGLFINLCLGAVYSWSIFRKPLEKLFNITATQSGLPYMFFLVFFALLMPIAGRFLDKYGPRIITMLGGALVGLGWILASFASNIYILTISYGFIAGGGVGVAYGAPIATSTKWFPDKKGLAVGLTIIGFGLSPLITSPLSKFLIDSYGPLNTFRILGILFFVIIILLAIPIRFPSSEFSVDEKRLSSTPNSTIIELDSSDMLKTSTFYGLWSCYVIGTLSGLTAIGISCPVGEEIIKLNPAFSSLAVSVFAIFNGIGRPLFGWLTDKLTPRYSAIISFIIIILCSIGMLNAGESEIVLYVLSFCGFWLCLGGWLSIAPTATSIFFGTKHYSKNYGIVYTAYGIGAIFGCLISGKIRDIFGSYIYTFYPTAILAILGIIIAILLIKPVRQTLNSPRKI